MVAKVRQSATDSPNPKPEVGEIDTSPPFQSVKDAVSLFGEGAFSGEKPILKKAKPYSAEVIVSCFICRCSHPFWYCKTILKVAECVL